jgi:uncharacterized protein (DUF1800 family)
MDTRSAQALIRFGLGRWGDEPVPLDPVGWLDAQLDGPDPALNEPATSCTDALRMMVEDRRNPPPEGQPHRVQTIWRTDAATTLRTLVDSETPFRERLVWFWANHFTISLRRGDLHAIAIAYVREAIRPHVTGRFVEMLMAVIRHPAMLWYLDNQESVGPNSEAGQKSHRGLNENLARECLELHTLGADAGYTQQDVTALAKLLTGWWFEPTAPLPVFNFAPHRHEPGSKLLLGLTFPPGEEGGIAALTWLGNHPFTFRHIATKLARHFVADDPAPADVERIADALRSTRGDLAAAARALIRLPSAWQALAKLRAPWEYTVAVVRALGLAEGNRPDMLGVMNQLGQPFMSAPLPNGWADTASVWSDGELLLRRADWALSVTGRAATADPVELAGNSLGELLSPETLRAVQHATSRHEALALLVASPEFQRR